MASVLFVTWDGGGNVPPALGIAAELQRRGDKVRFLGHPPQRGTIEGAGFEFTPYTHARPWSSVERSMNHGLRGALTIISMFNDSGTGIDLLAEVERQHTDLTVIDCMVLGALRAAERANVPRIALAHTSYAFLTGTWSRGPIGLTAAVKRQRPVRLWSATALTIVPTLRELDPAGNKDLPTNLRYVGPVWHGQPQPAVHDAARILVSLSTNYYPGQSTVLQTILDSIADLPVHALVTAGDGVDPDKLRAPANAELHRYLPHGDIMPTVALVIGHGGHDTTMRALAHDLPLAILPLHPLVDQKMNGRALNDIGAARLLPKTAKPPRIRAAITELITDGPHRAAAARLGAQIRDHNGAVMAAELIGRSLT